MGAPDPPPTLLRTDTPYGTRFMRDPRRPWPRHLGVTKNVLAMQNMTPGLEGGDGMLRFKMSNGEEALYGFAHSDGGQGIQHYDLIRVEHHEHLVVLD